MVPTESDRYRGPMLLTTEALSNWDVIDVEETAVSWSVTVMVKSPSDNDCFSVPLVTSHSKIPG